ncbi:reverse transcriptase domain-containing protein [Tanacetum coccineum]
MLHPRSRRTGGRTGRGGGRARKPTGRVGGRTSDQDGQRGDRGVGVNGGVDEVPDFSTVIAQQLKELLPTIIYQEFMACSLKYYDRKGCAIVYTRWIEKMESVQDMSRCGANQKVKYTAGSFIGKALTWWNTQVQTRGWEAAIGMTWEDFKVLIRKKFCPNNEMQKLKTEFWCHAMVEADHVAYTDRFHKLSRNASLRKNTEKKGNGREPVILGMTIRDLGPGGRLSQPLTMLGESTWVSLPSA